MALALTVYRGRAFYVGDTRVTLLKVPSPDSIKLRIGQNEEVVVGPNPQKYHLAPDVYIQSGLHITELKARVLITAPQHIPIQREAHYKGKTHASIH